MKISSRNPNNKTQSYKLLVGDNKIAELLSQISSAIIGSGNVLEKLIKKELENSKHIFWIKEQIDFEKYIVNKEKHAIKNFYFTSKLVHQYFRVYKSGKLPEPDFNFYFLVNNQIIVIEMKIGTTFDTKKVRGEIESINKYIDFLTQNLNNYEYKWYFCGWFAKNIDDLEKGTKGLISRENLMNSDGFKKLININTYNIKKELEKDQADNIKYIKETVNSI